MCCGGSYSNSVYEVNVITGKVQVIASMNHSRGSIGMWNYQYRYVFAFGGWIGGVNVAVAEKIDLNTKSAWVTLPNKLQRAKRACSVCEHSSGLYISGKDSEFLSSIEWFNLENETFRLVNCYETCHYGVICCIGDELFYVRNDTVEVASLVDGPMDLTFRVKSKIKPLSNGTYWLSCPVRLVKGEMVSILPNAGTPCGLFSFIPALGNFDEVVKLAY
jgi:hypothetical protein